MSGRSRRVQRFLWAAHGVTALAHGVPFLALGLWSRGPVRVVIVAGVWLVVALWLGRFGPDHRKPGWRTRLVDEPLFVHWGGAVLGLLVLPIAMAIAWALGASPSAAGLAAYLVALLLSAWGVWGLRRHVRSPQVDVRVDGLAPAFDGYRIAHLTDLHIGSFDRKARGLEWARQAAASKPDLVAVTGDLVTSGTAFYEDVAEVLGALSAPDGVLVTLGNHDQWDDRALEAALVRHGATVLRNTSRVVRRGAAELLVAGVDDPYTGKADLGCTLAEVREGRPTILLSHYPHLFEEAARLGADLVLSGHTHGGQLGVPLVANRWNAARLTGQRGRGLARSGRSQLFVSAGLGTTGPPMRIGVPPEIPIVVLRRGVPSPS